MRLLVRGNLAAPPTWVPLVTRSFADFAAFRRAAEQFEALPINSAERRGGFIAYVKAKGIGCFRATRGGKIEFKNLWGKSKEQIAAMSCQKCAYCEGEINASRAGQVEHFKPKTLFPLLAYEWNNYFLGCAGCNGAKSDKWPERGGYLRPDEGAPEKQLRFESDGTVATVRRGKAERTLRDFDLNRTWLVRRRKIHIDNAVQLLSDLLEVYGADASRGRRLIERHLARLSSPEMVYSTALRQCASREWVAARRGR